MSDVAESPTFGRCPTCGRLVTVPASARTTEVACPVCQHRARGAAFTVEAPLPVVLLDQWPQSAAAPAQRNGFEPVTIARIGAAPDEARTHLLLDVPMDDEDAPAAAPKRRAGAPGAEDARTHLLLNPSDLQDDEAVPEQASNAGRRPRVAGRERRLAPPASASTTEEGRTRLLVGPLSLRTEGSARGTAVLGWLVPAALRSSVWLDEALHGREIWARLGFAVVLGGIAPSLDYLSSGGRTTLGVFTWSSVLIGFGALALARLNGLRSDEGNWDPSLAVARLRTWWALLFESVEEMSRSPRYVKLLIVARALSLAAFAGFMWAGFLAGMRLLFGFAFTTTALPYLSGFLLLVAVFVGRYAVRLAPGPRFSLADAGDSLAAAAALPPVVDLSEPLPEMISQGTTMLHETLTALSSWRPREWPDEAAYRAALERHLQRQLPALRIERDRWVGRSRRDGVIDLVIDAALVITVLRGFHDSSAERALARVKTYARVWSGKPMILAIFDAPRDAMQSDEMDSLALLHDELALSIVRMPTVY